MLVAVIALTGAMIPMTSVNAAAYSVEGFEGNGPYGYNPANSTSATQSKVIAAVNQAIADLNTKIAAVETQTYAGINTAYQTGQIAFFATGTSSQTTLYNSNGLIDLNLKRSGWKTWDGLPVADIKGVNAGQSWDGRTAFVSYNAVQDKAYPVYGAFSAIMNNNKCGVPVGDVFYVGTGTTSKKYQNFTNGYFYQNGTSTTSVNRYFVYYKNVDENGVELIE